MVFSLSFFNRLIILIIKLYQISFSIFFVSNCRFYPSCSNYAIKIFKKYNFIKSLYFVFLRLLKCNIFHSGGFDFSNL
ncbi:membrane protein insertion efficiency factor YidD [Buchnera aphidicola]|uniref:membrane protein insertion efficiency factor YidD n=1 Tax=Buchnera aphidicola TaxID=9 RepID=UPI0031B867B0